MGRIFQVCRLGGCLTWISQLIVSPFNTFSSKGVGILLRFQMRKSGFRYQRFCDLKKRISDSSFNNSFCMVTGIQCWFRISWFNYKAMPFIRGEWSNKNDFKFDRALHRLVEREGFLCNWKIQESNFNNISGCSWILGVDIVLFKKCLDWFFDPSGDRWPAEYGRFWFDSGSGKTGRGCVESS